MPGLETFCVNRNHDVDDDAVKNICHKCSKLQVLVVRGMDIRDVFFVIPFLTVLICHTSKSRKSDAFSKFLAAKYEYENMGI